MARKNSGGFGKFMNFIGLVDDQPPRDVYENEYQGNQYGRPQTYVPQRSAQRRDQERSRQDMTNVRRYQSSYEPTRTPRMGRGNGAYEGRFDQPARDNRDNRRDNRRDGRREDNRKAPERYDYSPRGNVRTSRFGSLNEESNQRYEAEPQRNMPAQRQDRSAKQRTVMFSLNALEDCTEVIDNLIRKNTVILTMIDLDPRVMQRAVDTLSGAVYALHATIRKASEHTYLIAPDSVEVNEFFDEDDDRRYL